MSDHVDDNAPVLARDAAGGRLTDKQAVGVAQWYMDPDAGSDELPEGVTLGTAHDGAMAWIVAVAPVVVAARAQAAYANEGTRPLPVLDRPYTNWLIATHNTEEAVRALDGAE